MKDRWSVLSLRARRKSFNILDRPWVVHKASRWHEAVSTRGWSDATSLGRDVFHIVFIEILFKINHQTAWKHINGLKSHWFYRVFLFSFFSKMGMTPLISFKVWKKNFFSMIHFCEFSKSEKFRLIFWEVGVGLQLFLFFSQKEAAWILAADSRSSFSRLVFIL